VVINANHQAEMRKAATVARPLRTLDIRMRIGFRMQPELAVYFGGSPIILVRAPVLEWASDFLGPLIPVRTVKIGITHLHPETSYYGAGRGSAN